MLPNDKSTHHKRTTQSGSMLFQYTPVFCSNLSSYDQIVLLTCICAIIMYICHYSEITVAILNHAIIEMFCIVRIRIQKYSKMCHTITNPNHYSSISPSHCKICKPRRRFCECTSICILFVNIGSKY